MASQPALPWYATFICAGLGACTAEVATLPIDTAKVRLQLLNRASSAAPIGSVPGGTPAPQVKPSMVHVLRTIAAEEGFTSLYMGFWPAMHRQLLFASLRVGLYGQISALFRKPGEATVPLSAKIMSGLVAGAIGISIATPTDLVKVRFQSEGALAPGQAPRYSGVLNAYATIVRTEGLAGLWTGLGPNIARNSIINASELASYDTAKEVLLGPGVGLADGLPVHFAAATFAGMMATLLGNPVDVVKTRVMAAHKAAGAGAGAAPAYTGAVDCFVRTLRTEGPAAFYQGVTPQFFRITGWNIVMFITFEQLKKTAATFATVPNR